MSWELPALNRDLRTWGLYGCGRHRRYRKREVTRFQTFLDSLPNALTHGIYQQSNQYCPICVEKLLNIFTAQRASSMSAVQITS